MNVEVLYFAGCPNHRPAVERLEVHGERMKWRGQSRMQSDGAIRICCQRGLQRIDFDAIDAKPVDLIFLLLLPVAPHGEQLNALASVARLLRRTETLRELHHAGSSDELYRAMTAEF